MNRRQALKNFGLGAGILIIGPSTLSLLQSCKSEPKNNWEPNFLSISNGFALKQVLNIILPTTDTPGAGDLNIAQFIDSYMHEVATKKQQESFNRKAAAFAEVFEKQYDKELSEGSAEEYEEIIAKYLRAAPEKIEEYAKRNTETQDPQDKDLNINEDIDLNIDVGSYSYLTIIREMGIWAWKTSEEVGENVLWYDPIPGQYIACGSVEELGNGKTMAL
ncbi:gluconate 2-dehydrogenase subunit 3 family protein [Gillisia hiemivivida]|uniref:Gluconate 2-dehydrogenase subunit 3 family protein n=1 Tax=Gillisia hiemivivida TaxID=291190 RepID=A0A5C6ZY94_9FLAO|nr:gluconate 2-dehydrogenase subunit 3 family protein [Gillisia hiemivivida]TXD95281.1 gluconate 2-dehydrogenase subunit 3 family protein [Gillisia hiemivivida]